MTTGRPGRVCGTHSSFESGRCHSPLTERIPHASVVCSRRHPLPLLPGIRSVCQRELCRCPRTDDLLSGRLLRRSGSSGRTKRLRAVLCDRRGLCRPLLRGTVHELRRCFRADSLSEGIVRQTSPVRRSFGPSLAADHRTCFLSPSFGSDAATLTAAAARGDSRA